MVRPRRQARVQRLGIWGQPEKYQQRLCGNLDPVPKMEDRRRPVVGTDELVGGAPADAEREGRNRKINRCGESSELVSVQAATCDSPSRIGSVGGKRPGCHPNLIDVHHTLIPAGWAFAPKPTMDCIPPAVASPARMRKSR